MKKLIFISVILAFSLTCFAQKGKWKKAQKINTIESYQGFMEKYPSSEYLEEAKLKLTKLEFSKTKDKNSIIAYENFLKKYPKSEFAFEANSWIKEKQKELEEIKQAEQKAEQLRRNSIAKIKQYSVGVTTEKQFFEDGWNAKDYYLLKIGIIYMKKNNGYLTSVILGYRDRYNEEIAKQQQSLYEYAFSKNYGENSFSNLVVRNDSPHKICELRFSNGLLQSIEWYIK